MSDMRDIGASVWAGQLYGKSATLFKYLAIGGKFHFPHSPGKIMTKVSKNGWYSQPWHGVAGGKRFRTGTSTAVIPVDASRSNPAGKPRRSTSLAGLDPAKKWHRKCPFCSAKTNIDRLGSSSRTWQQWQCPECGKWVDRPEASRRNPSEMPRPTKRGVRRHGQGDAIGVTLDYVGGMGDDEYRVRFNGRVIAKAFMSPHGGGKENWSVEPLDDSGTWKAGVANGMRAAHAMVKLEALKMMKRVRRRINPSLGMPGMPHTWVTANGTHVSAGDQVEFWSSEGGYGDRKKVRRKGTVMRHLVFDDHVQVKKGSFGATVDDSNFIRVTRRGR